MYIYNKDLKSMLLDSTSKYKKKGKCVKIKIIPPSDPNSFKLKTVPPRKFVVDDKGNIKYVK